MHRRFSFHVFSRALLWFRLRCDETTEALPLGSNERTDRLLKAEQAVLVAGGTVVRLSGATSPAAFAAVLCFACESVG